jgi:hypothetical protein
MNEKEVRAVSLVFLISMSYNQTSTPRENSFQERDNTRLKALQLCSAILDR